MHIQKLDKTEQIERNVVFKKNIVRLKRPVRDSRLSNKELKLVPH